MLSRVIYSAAGFFCLCLAYLFSEPPTPEDTFVAWPVFVADAIAFFSAAVWPTLLAGPKTWIVAAVFALLGLGGGLLASDTRICCLYSVSELYGLPYPWVGKHATYESLVDNAPPPTFDSDAVWGIDWLGFMSGLTFWACLGIALVVATRGVHRLMFRRSPAPAAIRTE